MKCNKSPEVDGLPTEFYKVFLPTFGKFLTFVYNKCFINTQLTATQCKSVLSLIFKKGERSDIKNYRPVSLTTTDYKILTFIFS